MCHHYDYTSEREALFEELREESVDREDPGLETEEETRESEEPVEVEPAVADD